ncbi:hypothetical protein SADUNF_Sadunf16G0127800 [Salix dunnii]|uniref:Very-long-chain (3R)-3-hydroxyacyl-CoA dehydratase n=1 Tax=Salix dunnii TaxID=1413687 RepID=A0A835J9F6_9ROSI|nr:hypothetical protein SADUNF_Sadunf16G0127800 [Salix dunnii]
MAAFFKLYLFAYNSLQAFGWAVSLFAILINFFSTHSFDGAYASAGDLICLLQTVSFLEVIHGALGIVPSGVVFPFMQWGGRTHFVLAIVRQLVEVQELPSVFITFVAWSIAEIIVIFSMEPEIQDLNLAFGENQKMICLQSWVQVIRYSHYALNCIGSCPSLITYLRYTAFTVLYPIGLAPGESECMILSCLYCNDLLATSSAVFEAFYLARLSFIIHHDAVWTMYQALPFVKKKNLYANLFAAFPFSYYNFLRMAVLPSWQNIIRRNVEWISVMGLYWKMLCDKSYLDFSHLVTNINAHDKPNLSFQPVVNAVLICYPFLWLNLYRHLLKQRRSKLGRRQETKKKK